MTRVLFGSLLVLGLVVVACSGGDDDGDIAIELLSDQEVVALCESFHDDACRVDAEFCTLSCRLECNSADAVTELRDECPLPTTVKLIEICAERFGDDDPTALSVCSQGGGCIFDVFDSVCQ